MGRIGDRTDEIRASMRFVLQKHEREMVARAEVTEANRMSESSPMETPYLQRRKSVAAAALMEANTNLDAALIQFGETVVDTIQQLATEPGNA